MSKILLDLNNPVFQQDLFNLPKQEVFAVLKTLKKISQLTWEQVYQDRGLKWEKFTQGKEIKEKHYIVFGLLRNLEL